MQGLLRGGDTAGALALLHALRNEPDLSPPQALHLAFALRQTGDAPTANALALSVARAQPELLGAWEILLFAAMGTPDFAALADGFLDALRRVRQIGRKGIRRPLVLTLLLSCPMDAEAIARRAAEGEVLSAPELDLVLRSTGFLRLLARALRERDRPPRSWSLGIHGTSRAVLFRGQHALVDLSYFRGGQESGWTREFALALASAVLDLLPADKLDDRDAARVSSSALTRADHLPAMLLSPLLEVPRARLGADLDVRHAGRPLALPQGTLALRAGWIEAWTLVGWSAGRATATAGAMPPFGPQVPPTKPSPPGPIFPIRPRFGRVLTFRPMQPG